MTRLLFTSFLLLTLIFSSCKSYTPLASDELATKNTRKFYHNLNSNSEKGIMVGYEDALAYGLGWWAEDGMCDMFRVSGEYPAVYGWDLGDIHKTENLDSVSFGNMIRWIREVHLNGGVNTISWHMDNPVSGVSSWDTSKIVKDILPGGSHHKEFLERLDMAAKFLKACRIGNDMIPIIFRPYHEHNGNWFWWGKGNATEEEYINLYRFSVDYFKNKKGIHHLIYAFSPDRSRMETSNSVEEYLYGYPGDNYVDMLGLDNYRDVRATEVDSLEQEGVFHFVQSLEMLTDLAVEKGKPSALTETGSEGIKDSQWFSKRILNPIRSSDKAQRITYVLMWRNHDTKHHYMPYPDHPAEDDFRSFVNDPMILTMKDIRKNNSKATIKFK